MVTEVEQYGAWSIQSGVVSVSGNIVGVPITSGSVIVSGIVGVSGRVDILSGEIHIMSGALTIISGLIQTSSASILTAYPSVPASGYFPKGMPVTNASGGEVLISGGTAISTITIRYHPQVSSGAVGTSGYIYVGFDAAGQRPVAVSGFPTSSWGMLLTPGDSLTIPNNAPASIRVCATLSGDPISYGTMGFN